MNASDRAGGSGSNGESAPKDGMEQGQVELPLLLEVSNGSNDDQGGIQDGCEIFPEEVWKIIFGKLSGWDLWNLSNTCKLFEMILRPWKSGWTLERSLPYLYHHLPGSKLLECRLVSKSWNAGVDSFFENHTSLQPYDEKERDPRRIDFVYPLKEKKLCLRNTFNFSNSPDDNSAILEDPRFPWKVGRNPFIGRYVVLELGRDFWSDTDYEDNPMDPWWDRLFTFLDCYGREIWYLHLKFPAAPAESVKVKFADFMHSKLFRAMPNLKKLSIEFSSQSLDKEGLDMGLLPSAPSLETIVVPNSSLADLNIIPVLIEKYGQQLRKLHMNGRQDYHIISGMTLGNIQELVLDMGDREWYFEDEVPPEISEITDSLLEVRMPNLNMLQLNFPPEDRYDYALEDLLKVINKLTISTKLTTLRLAGSLYELRNASEEELGRITSDCRQFSLEPSTLKTLEIDFCWGTLTLNDIPPNYNFLMRCFPNLENLTFFSRNYCEDYDPDYEFPTEINLMPHAVCARRGAQLNIEEELELHTYMHRGDMYKSNIWELLPRLRVFTYQWMVFTREGFEAYSRKGNNEAMKN